jgi:hypothetical protein
LFDFSVLPYSLDQLIQCFVEGSRRLTSEEEVRGNLHSQYFKEYFETLGAAVIVKEPRYIDKDYLEDQRAGRLQEF